MSLSETQLDAGKSGWANYDLLNELIRRANLECPDGSVTLELGPNGWMIQVASSAGGGVPVRITGIHPDSPTGDSDVRMFRGDAYANGSEATASATGVTIRIMGLAVDVTEFPTSPMLATPISQSWTNASAVTVTETVYEVNPFAWWGVL